jgi:HPr kinase/phosphorylase
MTAERRAADQASVIAEAIIVHGVFLELHDIGVLISGPAGCGKSEIALALIAAGHGLIADDAPEFYRVGDEVHGRCPAVLQDYLQVDGLGVLNVRTLYGDRAVRAARRLDLIVELKSRENKEVPEMERLTGRFGRRPLLDVAIADVTIPLGQNRPLAVLVDAATRQFDLMRAGYSASRDFMLRQQQFIEE